MSSHTITKLFLQAADSNSLLLLQTVFELFPEHRLEKRDSLLFWNRLLGEHAPPSFVFGTSDENTLIFQKCLALAGSPFDAPDMTLDKHLFGLCSSSRWWQGDDFARHPAIDFLLSLPEIPGFLDAHYQHSGYHPIVESFKSGKVFAEKLDFFIKHGGDINGFFRPDPSTHIRVLANPNAEQHGPAPLYSFAILDADKLQTLKQGGADFSLPFMARGRPISFEPFAVLSLLNRHTNHKPSPSKIAAHLESIQPLSFDAARVLSSRDWTQYLRFTPEQWGSPFSNPMWQGRTSWPVVTLWNSALKSNEVTESTTAKQLDDTSVAERLCLLIKHLTPVLHTRVGGHPLWTTLFLDLWEKNEDVAKTHWGKIRQASPDLAKHLATPEGLNEFLAAYHERYCKEEKNPTASTGGIKRQDPRISHVALTQLVQSLKKPWEAWTQESVQGQRALSFLLSYPSSPFWRAAFESVEKKPSLLLSLDPLQRTGVFNYFLSQVNTSEHKQTLEHFLTHCDLPSNRRFEDVLKNFRNPQDVAHFERFYLTCRNAREMKSTPRTPSAL